MSDLGKEEIMNETQAAEFLKVTPGTLSVWRCRKRHALPYVKIGRAIRYRRATLEKWLDDRTHSGAPTPRTCSGAR